MSLSTTDYQQNTMIYISPIPRREMNSGARYWRKLMPSNNCINDLIIMYVHVILHFEKAAPEINSRIRLKY